MILVSRGQLKARRAVQVLEYEEIQNILHLKRIIYFKATYKYSLIYLSSENKNYLKKEVLKPAR